MFDNSLVDSTALLKLALDRARLAYTSARQFLGRFVLVGKFLIVCFNDLLHISCSSVANFYCVSIKYFVKGVCGWETVVRKF